MGNLDFSRSDARSVSRLDPHSEGYEKHFEERFWSYIEKQPNGCWVWTKAKNNFGYGVTRKGGRKGRTFLTHRLAWEYSNSKKLPNDKCVLHKCDNPPCVNPDHLFLGTRNDNVQDMVSKGRRCQGRSPGKRNGTYTHPESVPRGVNHSNSKLDNCLVKRIREDYKNGETLSSLSRRLKMDRKTLRHAIQGKTWAHVE